MPEELLIEEEVLALIKAAKSLFPGARFDLLTSPRFLKLDFRQPVQFISIDHSVLYENPVLI